MPLVCFDCSKPMDRADAVDTGEHLACKSCADKEITTTKPTTRGDDMTDNNPKPKPKGGHPKTMWALFDTNPDGAEIEGARLTPWHETKAGLVASLTAETVATLLQGKGGLEIQKGHLTPDPIRLA